MNKIKDFLMLFGFICIICSVLIGLGIMLAQIVKMMYFLAQLL